VCDTCNEFEVCVCNLPAQSDCYPGATAIGQMFLPSEDQSSVSFT
jgi:hypothetical protein